MSHIRVNIDSWFDGHWTPTWQSPGGSAIEVNCRGLFRRRGARRMGRSRYTPVLRLGGYPEPAPAAVECLGLEWLAQLDGV